MKTCLNCGETKPLDAYWRSQKNTDGKDDVCGDCRKKKREEWEATPAGIYASKARLISTIFRKQWFGEIDPSKLQIDHRFSLAMGFRRDVPLEVISNRQNLQLLTPMENRRKGQKCSIGLAQLYADFVPDAAHKRICQMVDAVNDPERLRRWAMIAHHRK